MHSCFCLFVWASVTEEGEEEKETRNRAHEPSGKSSLSESHFLSGKKWTSSVSSTLSLWLSMYSIRNTWESGEEEETQKDTGIKCNVIRNINGCCLFTSTVSWNNLPIDLTQERKMKKHFSYISSVNAIVICFILYICEDENQEWFEGMSASSISRERESMHFIFLPLVCSFILFNCLFKTLLTGITSSEWQLLSHLCERRVSSEWERL